MNLTCPQDYTSVAELYTSIECNIPINILFCIISFFVSGIILLVHHRELSNKNIQPRIFLYWSSIQNLIIIIRPLISIGLKSHAWENLWHYILSIYQQLLLLEQ